MVARAASRPEFIPRLTLMPAGPDMAECQEMLNQEMAKAKALESAMAAQEADNGDLEACNKGTSEEVEAMQAEVKRLEAFCSDQANAADTKAQWQRSVDW